MYSACAVEMQIWYVFAAAADMELGFVLTNEAADKEK